MLKFVFHLYILEKNAIFNNIFFFFFFFSFLFILIVWVKVAHVPWRNCTQSATWMVWPTGLGHLAPSYLCPGGVWRGWGLLDTEVLHCPSVSPLLWLPGVWVGGGGCSHSPRAPAYYLCLSVNLTLLSKLASTIHHEGKKFSSYLQNQSNATCFFLNRQVRMKSWRLLKNWEAEKAPDMIISKQI